MRTHRRWPKLLLSLIGLIVLLPLALIKWGLPVAVRHSFDQFLEQHDLEGTAPQIQIDLANQRIDLTHLTLRTAAGETLLAVPHARVTLSVTALKDRQIQLTDIRLNGGFVRVQLTEDGPVIAGQPLAANEVNDTQMPTAKPWSIRIDQLHAQGTEIELRQNLHRARLDIDDLRVNRLRIHEQDMSLTARLRARLNQRSHLDVEAELVTQPALLVHARVHEARLHKNDMESLVSLPEQWGDASARLSGEVQFSGGELPTLQIGDARVIVKDLSGKYQGLNLSAGQVSLAPLRLLIEWPDQHSPALTMNAPVQVDQLSVEGESGQWLSWQRLDIPMLHISGLQPVSVRAGQVALTDMALSRVRQPGDTPNAPPLLQTRQLVLSDMIITPDKLSLSQVDLSGAQALIDLDRERRLTTLLPLPPFPSAPDVPATGERDATPNDPKQPFQVSVGSVTLDQDSVLRFHDAGVSPPFERTLFFQHMRVTRLQNTEPDTPADLEARLTTDAGARIAITGSVTPFRQPPAFQLQLDAEQVALPRVSAYLSQTLGYEIESGDLDARVTATGTAETFTGTASIRLARLNLKGSPHQTLAQTSAIPLDVALNQLKEGDGVIELEIPFSQHAGEADIGLGDFVGLVMKKALYQAARSYLINTFVPYANVVTVVELAGKALFKLRFKPLAYQPGQLLPGRAQMDYLAAMKAVLDKRPSTLRMCPRVLRGEAEDLTADQLNQLPEDLRQLPAVRVLQQKLLDGMTGEARDLAFAEARAAIFRYMAVFSGLPARTFIHCGTQWVSDASDSGLSFSTD